MIVVTNAGPVFGPFDDVQELADRLRCDGADLPFNVIGPHQTLTQELPEDFAADRYRWTDGALVPLAAAPDLT